MRLYSFEADGARRFGAELRGQLIDLSVASAARAALREASGAPVPILPRSLDAWLRMGGPGLALARETVAFMARRPALPVGERTAYGFDEVHLLPPVVRPGKILCTGGAQPLHSKLSSALIGCGSPVMCPPSFAGVTVQVCVAAILGAALPGGKVGPDTVVGYALLLDLAGSGDGAANAPFLSRNCNTFCPLGPGLQLTSVFHNADGLRLSLSGDGGVMKEQTVKPPSVALSELIRQLGANLTLEAGDIIACSVLSSERIWKRGEVLRVEVEQLGKMEHTIVDG